MSLFGISPASQRRLLSSPLVYPTSVGSPSQECAFTEFITLIFNPGLGLEDESTAEGKVFADVVQALVESPGTRTVWWGRVVDQPQVVKFFVDWKSKHDHSVFHTTTKHAKIGYALAALIQIPATSFLFDLGPGRYGFARNPAIFCKTTAIYRWYLPIDFNKHDAEAVLADKPSAAVISSLGLLNIWLGRLLSDYSGGGQQVPTLAFGLEEFQHLGKPVRGLNVLVAWKNIDAAKDFFSHVQQASIAGQAFAELCKLGIWAGDPEYVDLVCFGYGREKRWYGSVSQSLPPRPIHSGLFGSNTNADPVKS